MEWHKKIYREIPKNYPLKGIVEGYEWGLSCNSIHFIDLFSWWTNENLISVDTTKLNKKWQKSKRNGFYEISGEMLLNFSNGSILKLKSSKHLTGFRIKINNKDDEWILDIDKNIFSNKSKNLIIKGNELKVSEMTNKIVHNILTKKNCDLTTIKD